MSIYSRGPHRPRSRVPSNCRYLFQSAACAQIHVQGAGVYAAEGVVVRCCCAGWYCSVLLQCVAVCCSRRLSTFQLLLPVSVGCVPNTHPRCMCVCCRLLLQVCMLQVVVVGTCCRVLQPFHMPQLQCVAVCSSVLHYVTVCCRQGVAGCCRVLLPFHMPQLQCCSLLQYFTVCCSVLQRVVECCRVLQSFHVPQLQCVAVCCSVLQYFAVCYIVLQGVARCFRVLHGIAAIPCAPFAECCSVLQ